MPLPENRPLNEMQVNAFSSSIGGSPVVAYARVPFRGKVLKTGVVQNGAVGGTATVAVAINGNAIAGGGLAVTAGGTGTLFTAVPTGGNDVNEDDVVSFTPSGATGAVQGHFFALIRRG